MILQGFVVLLQVKVGVAQLAVDGAQDLKVLRSHLDGRLKEGHAGPIVSRLAQALALQGEVQARRLHPAEPRRVSIRMKPRWHKFPSVGYCEFK